jgi:hypothetical protein
MIEAEGSASFMDIRCSLRVNVGADTGLGIGNRPAHHSSSHDYKNGRRLILQSALCGMRMDQITSDDVETTKFHESPYSRNCAIANSTPSFKRNGIGKLRPAAHGCLAYEHPVAPDSPIVTLGEADALLSVEILRAGDLHLCSVLAYFIGQHGCSRIDARTPGWGGNTGYAIAVFARLTLTSSCDAGSAVPDFLWQALVGDRRILRRVRRVVLPHAPFFPAGHFTQSRSLQIGRPKSDSARFRSDSWQGPSGQIPRRRSASEVLLSFSFLSFVGAASPVRGDATILPSLPEAWLSDELGIGAAWLSGILAELGLLRALLCDALGTEEALEGVLNEILGPGAGADGGMLGAGLGGGAARSG